MKKGTKNRKNSKQMGHFVKTKCQKIVKIKKFSRKFFHNFFPNFILKKSISKGKNLIRKTNFSMYKKTKNMK